MTDWYWVRHGPTHAKTFAGWRDIPADLSDVAQIELVRRYLPQDGVCISSDLSRAITTADAVAPNHTRLPHSQDLREFNFGEWDGQHFSDVGRDYPELSRAFWETPGDVQAPNGESWNQAATRIGAVVDDLNTQHKTVIAVAHFGAILTQVQRALGVTAYKALAHKIDNFSITHLRHTGDGWQVLKINHLP